MKSRKTKRMAMMRYNENRNKLTKQVIIQRIAHFMNFSLSLIAFDIGRIHSQYGMESRLYGQSSKES